VEDKAAEKPCYIMFSQLKEDLPQLQPYSERIRDNSYEYWDKMRPRTQLRHQTCHQEGEAQ